MSTIFCLIAVFTALCKLVVPTCFSKLAQFQTFLLDVKQMHVVDSLGATVAFLLGAVFGLTYKTDRQTFSINSCNVDEAKGGGKCWYCHILLVGTFGRTETNFHICSNIGQATRMMTSGIYGNSATSTYNPQF